MTYNTESSTGVDDRDRDGHLDRDAGHDSEHDPRDPVYSRDADVRDETADAVDVRDGTADAVDVRDEGEDADDLRDDAYHAADSTPTTDAEFEAERDSATDTELDSAARRDATDTVDDDAARDEDYADTRAEGSEADREAAFDAEARGHDADYDETRADETDAARDADVDYDTGRGRVDGEDIAVPAGPVESNPPTAVAVAPVNAAVPAHAGRDEADVREAETDRDAVEAVNADAGTGTVYRSDLDESDHDEPAGEYDEQRADNGPIVAGTDTPAETSRDEMMPGGVEPAPVSAFWNDSDAQGIRDRWRELQLRFIDDPQTVTGEAERLVEEAVASLSAALAKARQDLGDWRDGQGNDTERLRAAVRSYRDFLDRILGL